MTMKRFVSSAMSAALVCLLMTLAPSSVSAQDVVMTDEPLPIVPSYAEKILVNDTLTKDLSREALQVIGRPMLLRTTGYRPSASLFAPLLFDLWKLPSLQFDRTNLVRQTDPRLNNSFIHKSYLRLAIDAYRADLYPETGFAKRMDRWTTDQELREQFFFHRPDLVPYTSTFLPADRLEYKPVVGPGYSGELAVTDMPNVPTRSEGILETVSVDRKYWLPHFEAHAQLAQNEVSSNWHKGGNSSANFSSRLFYQLAYKKDKVNWVNEVEYKLGLFTIPGEVKEGGENQRPNFRIGEDVFRMRSNFGINAWHNWFYTVDLNLRSQLLTNHDNDGNITTKVFAPLTVDGGIGMKYSYAKKAIGGNPFNNVALDLNIAPASAQLIWIWAEDVSHGRYGLTDEEDYLLRLGSSFRFNLNWQFTDAIHWRSRVYYNTSYHHVEAELENTLEFAFNQYFSTMLSVNLRFDDSVIIDGPKDFKSLLQYNEFFSFGFSYKL